MPAKQPITAEDLYNLHFVEDPQISPDGQRVAFVRMALEKRDNKYRRHIWLAELAGGALRVRQFTYGSSADRTPRFSPDGQTLAFLSNRSGKTQIHLISLNGGEARPLTSHPNGVSGPAYVEGGAPFAYSPDGRRIAFLVPVSKEERRREDSGSRDDPDAMAAFEAKQREEAEQEKAKSRIDPRVITRLPYRTGTEFLDDRYCHIYTIDIPAADAPLAKPYRITDGELDFSAIAWTVDGKYILSTQPRDPDYDTWYRTDLVRIAATGKRKAFRRLTRPGHSYSDPKVSPDGQWIAAVRQLDSGSSGHTVHLAVLPVDGGPVRDLTLPLDRTVEALQWTADSQYIYFQAGDQGNTGIYRVSLNSGVIEKHVGGRRLVLGFSISNSGRIAFAASTPERPADLYFTGQGGANEQRVTDFNGAFLAGRHVAATEELRFAAPDGREIQGWLLKPIGFKKGKKYPLVVSMHGGPQVMWSPSTPSMWLEWQLHAARGYAVFYCNPRGSQGYGDEFTTLIHNDWGDHVMHDILAGVDRVTGLGFVDPKRMALTGGSYAGYMAAWIVGHDRRFACAWAQRGLYNFVSFHGTTDIPQFIEREFDMLPFDNLEKSWAQSPLAYVRNIRTPLAIEHQDQDYRCPVSDAEQLFAALKRLKRPVVFYRYPREGHEMSRSGEPHHRVDRLNRMMAWFDRYCLKG
ncbi:MAG: S9 family peptidase [Chloroflexi bacterium]|nr:S9 family peptidase [Chloroflexota bacterium]